MAHMTTAEILRHAREETRRVNGKALTQTQVAKATGLTQAQISRMEERGGRAALVDKVMGYYEKYLRENGQELLVNSAVKGTLGIVGRSEGKLGVVRDLMAPPIPKDWIVGGLAAKKAVTIVAGQEGANKSMLTQTFAVALANGETEVAGFRLPGKPQRVLVIDVENVLMNDPENLDPSIVTERLQSYGLTDESAQRITLAGGVGFDLSDDLHVIDEALSDAEKEGAPYDLLILDSFRSLWQSGSENTNAAGRLLIRLNRLAYTHNLAVILLHHQNKAGARYAGHTSIGSTVAAVWTFSHLMHVDEESGKKVTHPTHRLMHPEKARIRSEATQTRVVKTSSEGVVSAKDASEYEGFEADYGSEENGEGEG